MIGGCVASFPGPPPLLWSTNTHLHNFHVCIPEQGSLGTRLCRAHNINILPCSLDCKTKSGTESTLHNIKQLMCTVIVIFPVHKLVWERDHSRGLVHLVTREVLHILAHLSTQSGGTHLTRSDPASSVQLRTNCLTAVASFGGMAWNAWSTVIGFALSGRSTNSLESLKMAASVTARSKSPEQNTSLGWADHSRYRHATTNSIQGRFSVGLLIIS